MLLFHMNYLSSIPCCTVYCTQDNEIIELIVDTLAVNAQWVDSMAKTFESHFTV